LLGLAPYPPVNVSLKGAGPLSAWRADFDARIEGLADVTASLGVDRDQVTNQSLEGRADVVGMLEPPLKSLVSGGINFSLAAHLEDFDAVSVDDLRIATSVASVSGSGNADLAGNSIDAAVDVSAPSGDALEPLISPLRLASVTSDIKLSGALTAPAVDFLATARGLETPGVVTVDRLDISAQTDLSEATMPIDARVDAHGLSLVAPAAASLTGDTAAIIVAGAYNQESALVKIENAEVNSGPTALSGNGQLGLSTQQVVAKLDATVADVSELGRALGMPLAGRATLSAETEGTLETLTLHGSVRGEML
jgi:hypothetical protein